MIVDDEFEVYVVMCLVFNDFILNGRVFMFLSVYDGEEVCCMFCEYNDIVVVLLDVVMELDDVGLWVVDYIRNDLENYFICIILCIG